VGGLRGGARRPQRGEGDETNDERAEFQRLLEIHDVHVLSY
jgi:hypothetical protein